MGPRIPAEARRFRASALRRASDVVTAVLPLAGLVGIFVEREPIDWGAAACGTFGGIVCALGTAWAMSCLWPVAVPVGGFYGYSTWGRLRFIQRQDTRHVGRFRLLTLRRRRLVSEEQVVWLPLFIRHQKSFEHELLSFLPPAHLLNANLSGN
jgi:hypothetical protein